MTTEAVELTCRALVETVRPHLDGRVDRFPVSCSRPIRQRESGPCVETWADGTPCILECTPGQLGDIQKHMRAIANEGPGETHAPDPGYDHVDTSGSAKCAECGWGERTLRHKAEPSMGGPVYFHKDHHEFVPPVLPLPHEAKP